MIFLGSHTRTGMLQQERLELLTARDEVLERGALDAQAEVQREALEVDTVGREQLDVRVVNERDAVQVDDAEVRRVSLDLADVHHLVHVLLALALLERTCTNRAIFNNFSDKVSNFTAPNRN